MSQAPMNTRINFYFLDNQMKKMTVLRWRHGSKNAAQSCCQRCTFLWTLDSSPAVADGVAFVGSDDKKLHAVSLGETTPEESGVPFIPLLLVGLAGMGVVAYLLCPPQRREAEAAASNPAPPAASPAPRILPNGVPSATIESDMGNLGNNNNGANLGISI